MKNRNLLTEKHIRRNESGFSLLLAIVVWSIVMLFLLLYGVTSHAQLTLVYNQSFTGGVTATTQCTAWNTYRASLLASYSYVGFKISGSQDPVGITCTDPVVATAIANSLRTGTNIFGLTSDGHYWFVQTACGSGCGGQPSVELGGDVTGGGCSCSSGYSVRPGFGTPNWGGINGPNCGGATQTMIVTFYTQPVTFVGGASQTLSLCENATAASINTLLKTNDGTGLTETWSINTSPAHGTISGLPVSGASGMGVSPTGVTYTPAPGYSGTDVFSVDVNDGYSTATTTIHVTINAAPAAIAGPSVVCTATSVTLTETTTGGTWTSSNVALASIGSASGIVTGISAGSVTITNTAPGGCATTFPITVNTNPAAITGPGAVCSGSTLTLSDGTTGGSWSSASPGIATVAATTGIVTGGIPGTAIISYIMPGGCSANVTVTVNTTPAAITGSATLCTGNNTTLTEPTGGGAWGSSNPGLASVGPATGIVSGTNAGAVTMNYTTTAGCTATFPMTINPTPAAIAGPASVCTGSTITLSDAIPGGSWTSSNPAAAPVAATTGLVNGSLAGTATIIYTLPGGCNASATITVNTSAAPIGGSGAVCTGSITTLTETTGGGTWTSSNTAIATIGAATGIATGVAPGTVSINYAAPGGCSASLLLTVNATPGTISGPATVCPGSNITLADATTGGSWTSGNPAIATISPATGLVTGVTAGMTNMTYTMPGGCNAIQSLTVNALPAGISGPSALCTGNTTTLTDATTGGSWTSSNPATASIDATTGLLFAALPGSITVTYTAATGCYVTHPLTVNAAPAAITGMSPVCPGFTIVLTDAPVGGTWTSSNPAAATVGLSSGIVMGIAAGAANITYTLPGGCYALAPVSVSAVLSSISGTSTICTGNSAILSDVTPGGTWSSTDPSIVSVSPSTGLISGLTTGSVTISYTLGGCNAIHAVTADPVPTPVAGSTVVCATATTTLTDATPSGAWSSSDPAIATVGSATGLVTGISAGTVNITYSLGAGCSVSAAIAVNPLPAAIGGTAHICVGSAATLTEATAGGVWSSVNPSIATVSGTGLVTGLAGGTDTILYTLPTGCSVQRVLPVISVPAFTGLDTVCAWGDTVTIYDSNPGGIYTSSMIIVDNEGGGAALVVAHAPGIATITYQLPIGCSVTESFMVHPLPAQIAGNYNVCNGMTGLLTDGTTGGVWNSSNPAIAAIDSFSGVLSGFAGGSVNITYTLPTGCRVDTMISVTAAPAPLAGPGILCAGSTVTLSESVTGGTWSSSNTTIATVAGSGTVTGIASGTATITYATGTSCMVVKTVTVQALPSAYVTVGGGNYCAGGSGVHVWLDGSDAGIDYQLYNGTTAIGTPMAGTGLYLDFGAQTGLGLYTIVATNPATLCVANMVSSATISSTPLPAAFTVTGGGNYCAGGTGVHIGLGASAPGVQYQLFEGTTAAGFPVTGSGAAIDFGLFTVSGIYTVTATNTTTTCSNNMSGSATVGTTPVVTPSVSVIAAPGDTVCAGIPVTLTTGTTNGGSSPTFQWNVNGVNAGTTGTYYTFTPASGDVIHVVMTSNAACALPDTAGASISLTVLPVLLPVVSISATPGTSIGPGQSVTFSAAVTGAGTSLTYQWELNGVAIAGATGSTYTSAALANGDQVTCAVVASGACGSQTGNGNVIMTVSSNVGVQQLTFGNNITVSPNPNHGNFTVTGNLNTTNDESIGISLTDMLGREVFTTTTTAPGGKINETILTGNNIAGGTYLLSLLTGNSKMVFHIVVVK